MRWQRARRDTREQRDGGDDRTWRRRIEGVLADPERLVLAFQPIVSVADASVVGYEALSRFPGTPSSTPVRVPPGGLRLIELAAARDVP